MKALPSPSLTIEVSQVEKYLNILFDDMSISDNQHICINTPHNKRHHYYFDSIDDVLNWIENKDPMQTFYCQVFSSCKLPASETMDGTTKHRIPITSSFLRIRGSLVPKKS